MRTRRRGAAVLCVCALILALASCGSDRGGIPDGAVLITQGTDPRVEGLSIGLASVSGDEARLSIAQPEQQSELVTATAGEIVEVGDYTIESFEVVTNDEGGAVRLKVTPPSDVRLRESHR